MAERPSVPEIITVNSEALQTQIRDLLPSQNGFGSELQASNVIFPIIDLTATAEGSGLPISLQQAIAFGSQTAFNVFGTSSVVANSPGFYRLIGVSNLQTPTGGGSGNSLSMTDGLSVKTVWLHQTSNTTNADLSAIEVDLIFWLAAGESLSVVSTAAASPFSGSIRQVADSQGALVQPNGFPL